jgi:predicted polyphosphate/ATP-dependent NAD kinase
MRKLIGLIVNPVAGVGGRIHGQTFRLSPLYAG